MPDRREFLRASAFSVAGLGAVGMTGNRAAGEERQPASSPEQLRERLLECLGGRWPEGGELRPEVLKTEQRGGYRLEWVRYEAEPGDRVPAILLVPDGVTERAKAPGICVWHQHAGNWKKGNSEPAGLMADPMHHTGVALAKLGYVVLCPDALCFEERQDPTGALKDGNYERFEFLRYVVAGRCMAWKNILDMRRAVGYLASRPEVNADKLGCYGHSMGSTFTWLVGPWETRFKCLVGNCCLPTYAAIRRTHLLHCFPNFIPGWERYGDTPDIAGLTAPRALHLNFGETDAGSPIEEVREGVKTIAAAYEAAGAADRFTFFIEPGTGHVLSPAMWERVQETFRKYLA